MSIGKIISANDYKMRRRAVALKSGVGSTTAVAAKDIAQGPENATPVEPRVNADNSVTT